MKSIGIDISKDKFDIAIYQGTTHIFPNTEEGVRNCLRWIDDQIDDKSIEVGLEATGRYGLLVARLFTLAGHTVYLLNAFQIKAYRDSLLHRNKTDLTDARLIARFVEKADDLTCWALPDPVKTELQELSRLLDDLITQRTAFKNRLQSLNQSASVNQLIQLILQDIQTHIQQIEHKIYTLIDTHQPLAQQATLLRSIPGFGPITVARILAEMPAWSQFETAKQFAAYVGVTPSNFISGNLKRRGRISKRGNAHLRSALYFPAISAMRSAHSGFDIFAHRLLQNGKSNMQVIVAVIRKLLHITFGVLKSGQPFNPDLVTF